MWLKSFGSHLRRRYFQIQQHNYFLSEIKIITKFWAAGFLVIPAIIAFGFSSHFLCVLLIYCILLLKRCYWRRGQLSQPQCLYQSFTGSLLRVLQHGREKRCSRHCVDSRWWLFHRGAIHK